MTLEEEKRNKLYFSMYIPKLFTIRFFNNYIELFLMYLKNIFKYIVHFKIFYFKHTTHNEYLTIIFGL